jgi:hypothetical protein
MVRGCQKKIIYLKNTGSEVFEEAYFLISDKGDTESIDEDDMIEEAGRILDECIYLDTENKKRQKIILLIKENIIPFLFGIVVGVIFTLLIK